MIKALVNKLPVLAKPPVQRVLVVGVSLFVTLLVCLPQGITQGEFNALVCAVIASSIAYQYRSRIGPSQSPDAGYFTIWAVVIVYLAFAFLVFLVRFELSRLVFLSGFLASGLTMVVFQQIEQRFIKPCFAVIGGGRIFEISDSCYAKYKLLTKKQIDDALTVSVQERFLKTRLKNAAKLQGISGFVADLHHKHADDEQRLIVRAVLAGYPVYHFREIDEMFMGRISIDYLSENQFGSTLPYNPYINFKRIFDLVVSIIMLPLFLTGIAIMALLVYLLDGRPVFFSQERIGYRGRVFTLWKLRSIAVNPFPGSASRDAKPPSRPEKQKKSKARPAKSDLTTVTGRTDNNVKHVTDIGKFMRRYRLDELPQIFNILCGEMSWVGPRPETRELVEAFKKEVRFYDYRHAVLPGLTGWAQVKQGHVASAEEAREKLRYDFYYLKHFSPWLDFIILVKTVPVVLFGQNKIGKKVPEEIPANKHRDPEKNLGN